MIVYVTNNKEPWTLRLALQGQIWGTLLYDNTGLIVFPVAGDFDIPSSREDVDRDSSWNQWLRSEIPQLFVHAMDVFSVRTSVVHVTYKL